MAAVIEHGAYFTSLPRERYVSQEIFERELDRIYHRQWLYFGHVSQIPAAGDYLAREIADESVVAMRAADGEIHAFLNVCRHRGSRLCALGAGHAKRIVCPYHQWTYEADGTLLNAPTIPDGEQIDYDDWGLHNVQVEVWLGFIFVCLGLDQLASLGSLLAADEQEFSRAQPERLKLAHSIVYDIAANWKAVLENFSECYHCPATHPELCKVYDPYGFAKGGLDDRWDEDPAENGRSKMWEYGTSQARLFPGAKTLSIDGEYVSKKLLGEFADNGPPEEGWNTGVYIRPARTSIGIYADFAHALQILPSRVDHTQLIQRWFVHEDAQEGIDYEVDPLIAVGDVTNRQDVELCELVQQGIQSSRYIPGPISPSREDGLQSVLATYLKLMDED